MWGPYAWMFLYTLALGYPNTPSESDKAAFKNFIHALPNLLPCEMCRHNLATKLSGELGGARMDDAVMCSEKLVRYVYDLESAVAQTTGKAMKPFPQVVRSVMSNTYKQAPPPMSARASTEANEEAKKRQVTLLWILLPVAVLITFLATWLATKKILKRK
jgi:hypothetical protein